MKNGNTNRTIVVLLVPISVLAVAILTGGSVWLVQSRNAAKAAEARREIKAERDARMSRLASIAARIDSYTTLNGDLMPPGIDDVDGVRYSYFGAHQNRSKLPSDFIAACEQGPASDGSVMYLTAFGAVLTSSGDTTVAIDRELRAGKNPPPSLSSAAPLDQMAESGN